MYVTLVHAHVVPEHVDEFVAETLANAAASAGEPGNVRFDILRSVDDPTRFVFYEAYVDAESAAAHKETAHYLRWRDAVAGWMAEPRQGVRYEGLLPPAARTPPR